jgi:hypothetical protein
MSQMRATSFDWVTDINRMHRQFEVHRVVRGFDADRLRAFLKFRVDFLQEELDEAKAAIEAGGPDAGDDVVDAMIDLCVVAIGTLDLLDVDAHEAWDRVLKANLAKRVGVKEGRPNPLGLPDLVKPEGWRAPRHGDNVGALADLFRPAPADEIEAAVRRAWIAAEPMEPWEVAQALDAYSAPLANGAEWAPLAFAHAQSTLVAGVTRRIGYVHRHLPGVPAYVCAGSVSSALSQLRQLGVELGAGGALVAG